MIQIGGVYTTTFSQKEGILLQKYCDRNGRGIEILFKSIGVRGRSDSSSMSHPPETEKDQKNFGNVHPASLYERFNWAFFRRNRREFKGKPVRY